MVKLSTGILVCVLTSLLLCARSKAATPTDLTIRVTATSFRVGVSGVYQLTVSNRGRASTDDTVTVTDVLPDGLTLLASRGGNWSCSVAGQVVTCINPDPLPAGSASTFGLSVGVHTAAYPHITNSLTVNYAADTNLSNNTTSRTTIVKPGQEPPTPTATATSATPPATRTATPLPPATATPSPVTTDLLLTNVTNGRFTVGGVGTYVLTVINVGNASTNTPIAVSDLVPPGLGFVSATGTGWTCSASDQNVSCISSNSLPPQGQSAIVLNFTVTRDAFPSVTNIATVAYAGDTNAGNDIGRRPTTIRRGARVPIAATATPTTLAAAPTSTPTATRTPIPANAAATDLLLTNTSNGSFRVGRPGFYTLTAINIGDAATSAPVTIVDTLPDSLGFMSAVGPGWTCSNAGQSVTCVHADTVQSGGGGAVSLEVNVTRAAFPTVTNFASLFYAGDTNAANDSALRPTTVRR